MSHYGHFNENGQFVITNPHIPEPWLHYLIRVGQPGTETFCSGVSYTGGGFDVRGTHENTFIDTQLHLNDADNLGRYLYIVDTKTGKFFTSTWQPVRNPAQRFTTTLGFGSIQFQSMCDELTVSEIMFVPREFDGWIQNVAITNTSGHVRELALYPFIPVHMGNALVRLIAGDNDGFFGGAVYDPDLDAIVVRRNHGTSVTDDPQKINGMLGNIAVFYCTLNKGNTPYETSIERFLGDRFHTLAEPQAVASGTLSSKNQSYLRRTCAAFKNVITLQPGETMEFAVTLIGCSTQDYYLNDKKQAKEFLAIVGDLQNRNRMAADVSSWWREQMERFTVASPDAQLNRAFRWLQYQSQIVYVLNRMKSRYHTGYEYGWGFRDILQDVLFSLPYNAETVAQALRHIATQMFSNGVCYHNFFIDQPGNKAIEASDDPLWFPNAVIQYCKETGEYAFLEEVVDYADVREGVPGIRGSILDHCLRAIDRVWTDRSGRGLPYMKDCDWNDDLNELRRDGKPNTHIESVMVAQQLYKSLIDMAGLFTASGRRSDLVSEYHQRAETVRNAIEKYAIDKEGYYKRALGVNSAADDLGSSGAPAAAIFLETQCFGILSGIADKQRTDLVLDAVHKYLDTDYGAMLCYPAYTDLAHRGILPNKTWNIEKEPPAMKENGSIFMHLNAWLIQAYAISGRGKEAVAHYLKTLPENCASDQDRYKSEPYIYPEYIRGRGEEEFGRGGHTWLTGTAVTMHQALTEYIFGLKADYEGLVVAPCIDPSWKRLELKRHFRGAVYQITILNPHGVETSVKSITVDGMAITGNHLPIFSDGKVHQVEAVMG